MGDVHCLMHRQDVVVHAEKTFKSMNGGSEANLISIISTARCSRRSSVSKISGSSNGPRQSQRVHDNHPNSNLNCKVLWIHFERCLSIFG